VQRVAVAAECAFLDQVAIEGGEVKVGLVGFGVDVRFVGAVVEADRGEGGAVLVEVGELGAVGAFLGPAAGGAGDADVDVDVDVDDTGRRMSIERSSALARILLGDSSSDGFPVRLNSGHAPRLGLGRRRLAQMKSSRALAESGATNTGS
jgi:hypothetical protein